MVLAAAVTVSAGAVLGCGSHASPIAIERGDPQVGLPLRGSLASDPQVLQAAARAWAAGNGLDGGKDQRLDLEGRVVALWAGHAVGRDVVVLANAGRVATVERSERGSWVVSRTGKQSLPQTSGVPVGTGSMVVLPTTSRWRFVDAGSGRDGEPVSTVVDGLMLSPDRYGDFGDGFVLPRGHMQPPRPASFPDVRGYYVQGVGPRVSTPGMLRRIDRFAQQQHGAVALWQAISAPVPPGSSDPDAVPPQTIALLWTGRLPGAPSAAVVAQSAGPSISVGGADPTDPENPQRVGVPLGVGRASGSALSPDLGAPAVAGAYLPNEDGPSSTLLVAGYDARSLSVLRGTRTITRRSPVVILRTPRQAGTPETVIYGRDRHGLLIAPLTPQHP